VRILVLGAIHTSMPRQTRGADATTSYGSARLSVCAQVGNERTMEETAELGRGYRVPVQDKAGTTLAGDVGAHGSSCL
jgi:hypothetical protein